jgi:predicted Zn-dependent protease
MVFLMNSSNSNRLRNPLPLCCCLILIVLFLSACATNPVTGRRELQLISEANEISIGKKQYIPGRQMQGGDYVIDAELVAYVNSVGKRLTEVSDRRLPYEFVILNNSVPNAWALPGGKIAVNRGLLIELESEAELAAVIAHEIVHAAARHGAKTMERGLVLQGAVLAAGIATEGQKYADHMVGAAQLAATLIHSKYGRNAELEADYYGMIYMSRAGYAPMAAVKLQETFVRLSKNRNQNWLAGLFATHPPSPARVEANRKTAATLGGGGFVGKETYLKKTARLRKTKPAYLAYEKGRKALKQHDYKQAMAQAVKALSIEPHEGLFYGLQGDINFEQTSYRDALTDFTRAIEQPGDYYYFFLQRGLSREKLHKYSEASRDLEKSVSLLPTAIAYNSLGNIAMQRGDTYKAKEYFSIAAASQSDAGRHALHSLVRLDLPQNPGNYITARALLDENGYLVARITNTSPLPVYNVLLRIVHRDSKGRHSMKTQFIPQPIAADSSVNLPLGIGPFSSPNEAGSVTLTIINAVLE